MIEIKSSEIGLSNKTNASLMMPLQQKQDLLKRITGLVVEWITVIAALFLSAQLNCIYSTKAQKYVPLPKWALLTTDGKMLSFLGLLGEVLEGVSNKMTEWWKTKHKQRGGIFLCGQMWLIVQLVPKISTNNDDK